MIIKSKLTQEDLADIVHLYDELKDMEPTLNKPLVQTTVQDIIDFRLVTKSAIKLLEGVLEYKEQDINFRLVVNGIDYSGAIKRLLSDSGEKEEDCSCDLVKELVDENEHLKNRVHNLQLYLDAALEVSIAAQIYLPESFSGMPGYVRDEKGSERE